MNNKNREETEQDLLTSLALMDYAIDYDGDIEEQIEAICAIDGMDDSRATVLTLDGDVIADTGTDYTDEMENHLDREEIADAIENGTGISKRYSSTMGMTMLYAAMISSDGEHIIRLAIPYKGIYMYIETLVPSLMLAVVVAMVVSFFIAGSFSASLTRPLNEIAENLRKVDRGEKETFMKHYKYDELNVITDSMNEMTTEINGYVKKLEMEKIIRQEFFTNASHELKTPLTSIKGYTELLGSGIVTKEEVRRDFLGRIEKEVDHMTNLINDILMISKLEANEVELKKEKLQLYPLVSEVIESVSPMAYDYDVKIYTECKPLRVEANDQHMRELISNLLVNAIKYNKPGGSVRLSITSEGKNMILVVSDTGVGIPKEAQSRVFERFYRVDKGRSRKIGGTGLGLSIVKHIINYYDGDIRIDSKVDIGTTFTARLPIIV